jgi:hypothetical protein
MSRRIKCRQCGVEIDATEGKLPDGWWYTATDAELALPKGGKPTCPQCLYPNFYTLERRELYED